MEKAKFEAAESYIKTIRCAERILKAYDMGGFYPNDIVSMLESNKFVQRSFIRWVENEKRIAEQKFKEI
jgi:hypothetical protein